VSLAREREASAPAAEALEAGAQPAGWRLYSRLAERDLWLARDERTRLELERDFPGMPVLTFAEIPALRGKAPELLRAILATKATFPGARVRR